MRRVNPRWVERVIEEFKYNPHHTEVMSTFGLKALLLKTGGYIISDECGMEEKYEIEKKNLGVGVYRVTLKVALHK